MLFRSDIKVTAAVTNTGSEALKILKYGTILDGDLPTRSFTISKDGVEADFTGIKLQVDFTQADESAFVVIPAGETVIVDHEGESSPFFLSAKLAALTNIFTM